MHQSGSQGGHRLNQKADSSRLKRKLPPPTFSTSTDSKSIRQNDPSVHQGRKRSRPHVDGDWPTHVYLSIDLPPKVKNLLKEIVHKLISEDSKRSWHSLPELESKDALLHLSLSRPIFLKTNERHEFLNQLQKAIRTGKSFEIHFATFSTFMSDNLTRGFLALEVGSGHSALRMLLERIDEVLESFFQPKYYSCPRFHVSIAWCLLDPQCPSIIQGAPKDDILSDSFLQNLNSLSLDHIRETSWKIHDLKVVIGKNTHQLPFDCV